MKLSLKIALRYFFSRKKSGKFNAISIISAISLLGYVVGAAALFIVLSVFNGFEDLFSSMYKNFDPDISISINEGKTFNPNQLAIYKIKSINEISTMCYVLEENVMVKYNDKQAIATIKAVDSTYVNSSKLDSNIVRGEFVLQDKNQNYAMLGYGLAYRLGVDPNDQFNFLTIYAPRKGKIDLLYPSAAFNKYTLSPSAIFSIQEEVDDKYAIIPLRVFAPLLEKENEISAIEIKLDKNANSDKILTALEKICGKNFSVKNRFMQRESFYKVVKTERFITYMILLFIIIIAAFNTIGSLYMLVIEKKKDISILSSMGITRQNISLVFIFESLMLAICGSIIGLFVGYLVCKAQQTYGWVKLNGMSSLSQEYPVMMKIEDVVIVFATLFCIGIVSSIYPARKAAKLI